MDEYVAILDENGNPTNERCLKSIAHRKGLFHATVHIWLFTSNGELLIQQRNPDKDTFPNLWDVSVAGHIEFGETPSKAALREIHEEIGLRLHSDALLYLGTHLEKHKHCSDFIDNELHHIYCSELLQPISSLKLQKEEVSKVRLINLEEIQKKISTADTSFVPHDTSYYEFIFKEVARKFNS